MYLKRSKAPKKWPLPRKGSKYLVRPSQDSDGLPLLIALRDIMGLAQNRKEVQKLLNMGKIKINNKQVRKVNTTIKLFDVLELSEKKFKLVLEGKKFSIKETKDKEKVAKVIGKRVLKGGKKQLNLSDGRNYETDKKCKVGDSIIIDLEKAEIKKILPLKKGRKVLFTSGRHLGEKGEIKEINNKITVAVGEGEIKTDIDSFIVIK